MQKAKGNHHKMSKTPEGSPSSADVKNNTPEGSSSSVDVENNSENPSAFRRMGWAAVRAAVRAAESTASYLNRAAMAGKEYIDEHTGADARKSTSEESTSASNEAKKSKANTPDESVDTSGKKTNDGAKSTSGEQASSAKPEAKKSKANTPDESVDTSGKKTNDGAKSTSGEQAPGAAERFMSELRKSLDKKRQDQGSSAAGSSEDKQDKDSNPNTGEAQTKETRTSPEKHEATINLERDRKRLAEASAAAESKNPLGKKRRQAELKAATEQLKKSELVDKAVDKLDESRKIYARASVAFETHFFKGKKRQEELNAATEQLKKSGLEYMRLKFADKIEAAKQDPEKQAELAAEMAQAAFASMQETSRVTTDKYDNMLDDRSKFKKAVAQVGKWFNNGGKVFQCIKLGGAGFGVGFTTGFFAAPWPITMAAGVVAGLGVAGLTKQAVLEEHRGEDRIDADARLETTDPSFKNTVANMKIDDVMEHAVNVSVDNLKDMSIERQDALRKKVHASLFKYSIGFALGGLAGTLAGNWLDNPAHATGAESQKASTTSSQSGSGQIPQQSGSTSSMHNTVNSVNTYTSNLNSYDYPWSWAADKFGAENAMDKLHYLADKAMADGNTVQFLNNPDGSVWMKVNGSSATKDVLDVLIRYV